MQQGFHPGDEREMENGGGYTRGRNRNEAAAARQEMVTLHPPGRGGVALVLGRPTPHCPPRHPTLLTSPHPLDYARNHNIYFDKAKLRHHLGQRPPLA